MMKIDWKRKSTSRKLRVAGFVEGLFVISGGSQENADKISGAILSRAADTVLDAHVTDCLAAGIDVGYYRYSYAKTADEARREAAGYDYEAVRKRVNQLLA